MPAFMRNVNAFMFRRLFTNAAEHITLSDALTFRLLDSYLQSEECKGDGSSISYPRLVAMRSRMKEYEFKKKNLTLLEDLRSDGSINTCDRNAISAEISEELRQLYTIEEQFFDYLLLGNSCDSDNELLVEVNAGVGGAESGLFAADLFSMYKRYAVYKHWSTDILQLREASFGGIRSVLFSVNGEKAFEVLQFEGGVHRVQRVPLTETAGRIHTSTAAVAIFPMPREPHVVVNHADIKVETFRSSSKGGQNVNKIESAVRLHHIPTGIHVECQVERYQELNRKKAMQKLLAILHERSRSEQQREFDQRRKLQVGSSSRSEKIRTYNFLDDRVSDHRTKQDFKQVELILGGGPELDALLTSLRMYNRRLRLQALMSWCHERFEGKFH